MTEPRDSYSPERRTALLFTGTGADGAYHAGAMRALQEAGVKIDVVGGRGIGAIAAVLAAVDGGSQLWDAGRLLAIAAGRDLLSMALAVHGAALARRRAARGAGDSGRGHPARPDRLSDRAAARHGGPRRRRAISSMASSWSLGRAFSPPALPTWIPRLAALFSTLALIVLGVGAWLAWWRSPLYRRSTGSRLWTLLGSPIDAGGAIHHATETVWRLLKGGAAIKTPEADDLSRRYAELLAENLGQPGFRELLLVVHDLDANRDLVFGLVRDPYRRMLFPAPGGVSSSRRAEAQDLSSGTQGFLADVLAAALSLPGRQRIHGSCGLRRMRTGAAKRIASPIGPASIGRLLEEAAAAGAEQVVIVAATPEPPGPHELRPPRLDGLGRVGEQIASAETAALSRRGPASASSIPGPLPDSAVAQPDSAARSDRRLRREIRSRADARRVDGARLRGRLPPVHRAVPRRVRRAHDAGEPRSAIKYSHR